MTSSQILRYLGFNVVPSCSSSGHGRRVDDGCGMVGSRILFPQLGLVFADARYITQSSALARVVVTCLRTCHSIDEISKDNAIPKFLGRLLSFGTRAIVSRLCEHTA